MRFLRRVQKSVACRINAAALLDIPNNTTPGTAGRNEFDTMADTSCAGSNWAPMFFTGDTVEVTPFSESYAPMTNIPVATCATLITTESGRDYLLIGNEMLWFGSALKRSLINPNQLRMHGITVVDDPTVSDGFGLHSDELFIPLQTTGTTVFFESRAPSLAEIESDDIPHIILTSEDPWNPHTVTLRPDSAPKHSHALHIAATGTRQRPVELQRQIYESDYFLGTISPSLAQPTFDERLIGSIKVDIDRLESRDRHATVDAPTLARKWTVSVETAQRTLDSTTQQAIRTASHPISRRYRVDHIHLNRRRLLGTWYTDTLFSKVKSLRGNTCAQVITNGAYTRVTPLPSRKYVAQALTEMSDDIGIPDVLVADLAPEMEGRHTEFQKEIRRLKIRIKYIEKGRHKQAHVVDREIQELKKRWRRRMTELNVPKRLWDYGLVYESELLSRIARRNRRPGIEEVTGQTPDISEYCDFGFYDLVWYYKSPGAKLDTTEEARALGRWLGVSHRVGSDLSYWILTAAGKVISSSTVQHVIQVEFLDPEIKRLIDAFNTRVTQRLDDTNFLIHDHGFYLEDEDLADPDDARRGITIAEAEYGDTFGTPALDVDQFDSEEAIDKYIGAQLILEINGEPLQGTVVERATDGSGDKIGRAHSNPLFDTREFIVQFPDESRANYTVNQIAEAIYSQVDSEGNQFSILQEIIDHSKDNSAIPREDGYWISKNGNRTPKATTRGWKLCVEWKDGTSEWVDLKDLKQSNPIELAEYAYNNKLLDEPAFKWWAPHVLKVRQRIVGKVKSRYWKTTHKFGVRLPHSVEEALRIDRETGTDFWEKAIMKERSKAKISWKPLEGVTPEQARSNKCPDLVGYQEIKCHMIFDVKMDLTRKARFVAGGHMTETPSSLTYASVVSRDSVRLAFLIAALNNIDVMSCDIGNAYLNAPCREKIWFVGGPECGEDRGKVLILVRALYGLKSSGAAWRAMLVDSIRELGFEPTVADPDVWRRPAVREDGFQYYELILVYTDDILFVSHQARDLITELERRYEVKPDSIGPPSQYLGAHFSKQELPDGSEAWAQDADVFIANAVKTVQSLLDEDGKGQKLIERKAPLPAYYKPEVEMSKELSDDLSSRYRQIVGLLRWAVELGRIEIFHETALMSQYLAAPREGHLEMLYHIFGFLKKHPKQKIVFDPADVTIDETCFQHNVNWTDFYGDVAEELPPKMPTPRGNSVDIHCFVDANHAGNTVTRRSHTGILIFVQNAPIIWFSKKQNTIESSSFGSEFVALRIAKELLVSLRYKLRMFGVPLRGPANVFCDNQGVVKNSSIPESTLNKKHLQVAYHSVREAVAAGILRVGKEDTGTNLADLFTKILPHPRRCDLLASIVYGPYFRDGMLEESRAAKRSRHTSDV